MDSVASGCSVGDCPDVHYGKGLCRKHWMRLRRKGTTDDLPSRRGQPAEYLASIRPERPPAVITCGHPDRKHGGNGLCHSCYVSAWLKAHPDANSGNGWSRRNPERAKVNTRRANLKKRGSTPEEYDRLWTEQRGRCANPGCRAAFPMIMDDYRGGLQQDHDHRTGMSRALLCPGCNTALGHIDDSAERLLGLVEYLRAWPN